MFDHRRASWPVRVGRALWLALCAIVSLLFLKAAAEKLGAPESATWRYREPASAPHVFVRGVLRRQVGSTVPAICSVTHERYQSCGKSRCWKWYEGLSSSHAMLEVTWSSQPLPKAVLLSSSFVLEPMAPEATVVTGARAAEWKRLAQTEGLGFRNEWFSSASDRIVESCLEDDASIFVEACPSSTSPPRLEPCHGLPFYGIVAGEPQSAIDAAADDVAIRLAAAFLALLVGLLAVKRSPSALAAGLEDRALPHRRGLGVAWGLLAVPPVAGMVDVLLHGSRPPSTWAAGRGGFALGISVLAGWLLFVAGRQLYRRRTLAALAPVLATPRSLLAGASGTVELAVRARLHNGGGGVRALIGDDVVAFSEVKITERTRQGKSVTLTERDVRRSSDELAVVDESGDGVLHLTHAILDVELRKVTLAVLPPRYAERGIHVDALPNHVDFLIEERVIPDGQPLYVFGDVSGIALKAGDGGYRAVRGAPTLGGADGAPVLVHAGDERGLVAMLTAEARLANGLAAAGALASAALGAALLYLASL